MQRERFPCVQSYFSCLPDLVYYVFLYVSQLQCDVCYRCSISKAELFQNFIQLLSEVPDSCRPDTLRF